MSTMRSVNHIHAGMMICSHLLKEMLFGAEMSNISRDLVYDMMEFDNEEITTKVTRDPIKFNLVF